MCLCVCVCVQGSPPHPCPGIWDWDFGTEILSERLQTQRHTRVCAHTSLGVNTAPQLCAHAGMCPPHTPNAGVHTRVHTHPSPSSKASHPSPAARLPPRRSHPLAVWRCPPGGPLPCVPPTRVPPRTSHAWPRPARRRQADASPQIPGDLGSERDPPSCHPGFRAGLRGSPFHKDRGRAPKSSLTSPKPFIPG